MANVKQHMARALNTARFLLNSDGEQAAAEPDPRRKSPGSAGSSRSQEPKPMRPGLAVSSDGQSSNKSAFSDASQYRPAGSPKNLAQPNSVISPQQQSRVQRRLSAPHSFSQDDLELFDSASPQNRSASPDVSMSTSSIMRRRTADVLTFPNDPAYEEQSGRVSPSMARARRVCFAFDNAQSNGQYGANITTGASNRSNSSSPMKNRSGTPDPSAASAAASNSSELRLPPIQRQQSPSHPANAKQVAAAAGTSPTGSPQASKPSSGTQRVFSGSHSHIRPHNNHKTGYKNQSMGYKPRVAPVGLVNERAVLAQSELDSTRYDKILAKLDRDAVAQDEKQFGKVQRQLSSGSEDSEDPNVEA